MQRAVTAMCSRRPALGSGVALALQLRRDGVGEVGLDLPDVADDAPGIELLRRSAAIFATASTSYGNAMIADCTDSMMGSSAVGLQCRAEPLQPGVVGEQQIVLGREVTIEGPQRDPGVGRDLFGRRVLDALGQESHQRGLTQRLARAFTARRLRGPDHGEKNTAQSLCQY